MPGHPPSLYALPHPAYRRLSLAAVIARLQLAIVIDRRSKSVRHVSPGDPLPRGLPTGQSLSRRKLHANHTQPHLSLSRRAEHLKPRDAKTKMRVRIRTSRNYDSQNPPDKIPFPTRPRGAPPRNCALCLKAEVRASLAVESVPERVEEVLRIVYLQGSSGSQKPGRQRERTWQQPFSSLFRFSSGAHDQAQSGRALPPPRSLSPLLDGPWE